MDDAQAKARSRCAGLGEKDAFELSAATGARDPGKAGDHLRSGGPSREQESPETGCKRAYGVGIAAISVLPHRPHLQNDAGKRNIARMFQPRQDYILVRPIERLQSHVLEVVSYEKHCRGEILAVGPGKFSKKNVRIPMQSQVGQIVIFGDGNFDFYPKFYQNGECLRIIQEADICGVLDDVSADRKVA